MTLADMQPTGGWATRMTPEIAATAAAGGEARPTPTGCPHRLHLRQLASLRFNN